MSQKIKPGHVLVEVVEGVEGPSLSIGDNDTGERIAGPKPWGGGRTSHCFQVAAKDLIRLAKEYANAEPSSPVEIDEFEREAMRIAVRSFGYREGEALLKTVLERRGNGTYCVEWVNGVLEGWQARATLERKP